MSEGGRPGECVVALDVGGTGMKGALLDGRMRQLAGVRRATPRADGPDAVVAQIAAVLTELAGRAAADGLAVRRAGVVVPGIVDEKAARAVYSANLGWRDLALADILQARTGLPAVLGHDVRAGGAAEWRLGAGRGATDLLFVALGTGIAGAVVSEGKPVRAGGYAGELGHLTVDPNGAACRCGGRGCLETVASAPAIAAGYTARSGRRVSGAHEVAALLERGDADARAVWSGAADALADALATATVLLAPELIVLGGGLAQAGEPLLGPVRRGLDERLTFQRRPRLAGAELGDVAGCLGAGLYAWHGLDVTGAKADCVGSDAL